MSFSRRSSYLMGTTPPALSTAMPINGPLDVTRTTRPTANVGLSKTNSIASGINAVINPTALSFNTPGVPPNVDFYSPNESWKVRETEFGSAVYNPYGATSYRLNSFSNSHNFGNGATRLVICVPRILVVGYAQLFETNQSGWYLPSIAASDGTNPRFSMMYNGSLKAAALADYELNKKYVVIASGDYRGHAFHINGKAQYRNTSAVAHSDYLSPSVTLWSPSNTAGSIDILLAVSWNRRLSEAEIMQVSENPWQIFDSGIGQKWASV